MSSVIELSESRLEAISRAVIVSRALYHYRHVYPKLSEPEREQVCLGLSEIFKWTADGVDASQEFIAAGFSCDTDLCKLASTCGPKGLYEMLSKELSVQDSGGFLFCKTCSMTGRMILQLTASEPLRSEPIPSDFGRALSDRRQAANTLAIHRSLDDRQKWDFAHTGIAQQTPLKIADQAFRGRTTYVTGERRKLDEDRLAARTITDGLGSEARDPDEVPDGTLRSLDTSSTSQAAWRNKSNVYSIVFSNP